MPLKNPLLHPVRRSTLRHRLAVGLAVVALSAGAADAATTGGSGQPKLKIPILTGLRATAPSGLLSGPDVSSNNHAAKASIRWGQVSGGGRAFTIVKATGEHGYTNPWFKRDWDGAGQAGLVRAAYHFAVPTRRSGDAASQANKFVTVVTSAGGLNNAGTLPLVLDLEQSGGLRPAALQTWVRTFLTTVESQTHRTPLIYTYTDFWRRQMANSRSFTHYPLWIASYTGRPPSPLPGGWPSWALWQYTAHGRLPGVRGPVDLSVFCCSAQTLSTLSDGRRLPVLQRWIATGGLNGPLGAPVGPLVSYPVGLLPLAAAIKSPSMSPSTVPPTGVSPGSPAPGSPSPGSPAPGSPSPGSRSPGTPAPTSTPTSTPPATAVTPASTANPTDPVTSASPVPGALLPTPTVFPGGSKQDFVGGSIYSSPAGTFIVKGTTQQRYVALGGPTGPLGFPTGDTTAKPTASGATPPAVTTFTGGTLVAPAFAPAYLIQAGPMLDRWNAEGGVLSPLGLPVGDTTPVVGGLETIFVNGALTSSAVRGSHEISGPTLRDWVISGGAASGYGLPSSDTYPTATGTRTDFGTLSINE